MNTALDDLAAAVSAAIAVDLGLADARSIGDEILRVQGEIDRLKVYQARQLVEADRLGIWKASGHRSIADWLAAKGKTTKSAAERQRKLGEAINNSPELSDAVDKGEISADAATELSTALGSEHSGNTADLVEVCKGATPAQARDAGHRFQELYPPEGQTDKEREAAKRAKRGIRFTDLGYGMTRIDGQLTAPDALTVKRALSAIAGKPCEGDDRTLEQRNADALVMLADAYAKGEVRGGRERPTVMVVIDLDALEGRTPGFGRSSDGTIIPAEIVRQMVANANLVRLLTSDSVPLDMGRSRRLATDDQFNALAARDGGCRFPGCPIPADWCHVDHLQEWDAQHGPTDLQLLALFCVFHHVFRHRPDVIVHGNSDNLTMTLPDGRTIPLPPRGPTVQQTKAA